MGRVRKRHIQLSLLSQDGTRAKDPRGGKRPGAGRKPKGERAGVPHRRRETFRASQPVHVSFKVLADIGELRKMDMYRALRKATVTLGKRDDVRIVHMSIQNTHLHLVLEADGKTALSRGIQAFKISAAKWINRAYSERTGVRRRGTVFADRYHVEIIRSPRQARMALAYVLNNWRRHREDVVEDREALGQGKREPLVDRFSSGIRFDGWKQRAGQGPWSIPKDHEELSVWQPRTWLLKTGWRRHGLISCTEVPTGKTWTKVKGRPVGGVRRPNRRQTPPGSRSLHPAS